jgi:hypothetical protein
MLINKSKFFALKKFFIIERKNMKKILVFLSCMVFVSLSSFQVFAKENSTDQQKEIRKHLSGSIIVESSYQSSQSIILFSDIQNGVNVGIDVEIIESEQIITTMNANPGQWSSGTIPEGSYVKLRPWIQNMFPAGEISFTVYATYYKNNIVAGLSNISTGYCSQGMNYCTINSIGIYREFATSNFPAYASMDFDTRNWVFDQYVHPGFLTIELNTDGQTRVSWYLY